MKRIVSRRGGNIPLSFPVKFVGIYLGEISGTGQDGSAVENYYSLYDSVLGVPCGIAMHADGSIRCLPTLYQAGVNAVFSNATCSTKLASDTNSGFSDSPDYAIESIINDQMERTDPDLIVGYYRYKVYSIGNLYSGPVYVEGSDSTCQEYPAEYPFDLYLIGSELPSSTFVEFTIE